MPREASRRATRVVLSGGPAAGKSTVLSHLAASMEGKTFVVPEAATWWMATGAARPAAAASFQTAIEKAQLVEWMGQLCRYQAVAEDAVFSFAESYAKATGERCTVLLDRCMLDSVAYCPTSEIDYRRIMMQAVPELYKAYPAASRETSVQYFVDRYDCVLFLPSLAVVSPDHYDQVKESNPHRREGAVEAALIDSLLRAMAHRHPRCVDIPIDAIRAKLGATREESMAHLQGVSMHSLRAALKLPTHRVALSHL
eukprot:TRINITY_DN466_c2_g1_i1.p1 TRINITY_DN466_c2_g1~~TRINITY_DN466_c2_g1_i1.p1  ORF type:complete len:255 (+),score=60.44 TRINITY_DN466_c2_g1_i1:1758-2522(+)